MTNRILAVSSEDIARKQGWDYSGISLSALCLIHCLITPLAAVFMPHMARWFHSEWVHKGLFFVIAPLALIAFFRCLHLHKSYLPMGLGLLGILFLALGMLLPHELSGESGESTLTIFGSLFLVGGHIVNIKKCRCLHGKTCSHSNH